MVAEIRLLAEDAPVTDLLAAIEIMRRRESGSCFAGVPGQRRSPVIVLGSHGCAELRGWASTRDDEESSGDDVRGLQPARAIRRALADAGVKAAGLDSVWAVFDDSAFPDARRRASDAVSLALGQHATGVAVHLRRAVGDGRMSAMLNTARAIGDIRGGDCRATVCVSIGLDGTNTALAFSATR